MLIHMLVPPHLKGQAATKYYDFASIEMNDLHRNGVDGVRVHVYGDTNDAPGRRELLNMEAVTAFYPCPHCLHVCQTGLRGLVHGGFRRFLPPNSPWRQREFVYLNGHYMFRDIETRDIPIARTDANVSSMISLARKNSPCCGHKGCRLLHNWIGVDWEGSVCDPMHDEKCFLDMMVKGLVGRGPKGMYKQWARKDSLHRMDCAAYGIFPAFANGDTLLPPWRLSKDNVDIVDLRIRSMWWPHYRDMVCKKHGSFWKHSDMMWKCSQKRYILRVLLPTCLHGFVKSVHNAVLMLVYALRKLQGQTISADEAIKIGILPGSVAIKKSSIPSFTRELIAGLVLLEGSFPVDHLNPNGHHFSHYGGQTSRIGILDWLSMFSFERNNKRFKDFARSRGRPMTSLAKNIQLDIVTRLLSYSSEFDGRPPPHV